MDLALLFVLAYLLGSIPFGVLIARARGVDILAFGSGNPGATNVSRALGKATGNFVFVLDVLKGLVPALAARALVPGERGGVEPEVLWLLVGLAAVAGHCLSPFLGFRGGKGVATTLGASLGAAPIVAGLSFLLFLVLITTVRYMSVAAVLAVASSLVWSWLPDQPRALLPLFAILTLFVVVRHRANFARLRAGTEPRFDLWRRQRPEGPGDGDGDDGLAGVGASVTTPPGTRGGAMRPPEAG